MGYTLEDVRKGIIEKVNSPQGKVAGDVAVYLASLKNPALGLAGEAVNTFLSEFDNYKANQLLLGLSSGLDVERQINELYNFVVSSPERAFTIGNIFRQTINTQTPKACVIYGYIISDHTGESERDFTQDELIVCNALVTATDFDIKNFKLLMEKCVEKDDKGKRKIVYQKNDQEIIELQSSLNTTSSWCVYNRIFTSNPMQWVTVEDETLKINTDYYVDKPADVLLKYIVAVQQILEYGSKETE